MSNFTGLLVYSDKPIFRIGRHLFLFISMILLFSWIVNLRDENDTGFFQAMEAVSLNALFFFGYAYLTAYVLVPVFIYKKQYLLFTLVFILSGFVISYLKFIFSDYLFYSAIAADLSSRFKLVKVSYLLTNTKDMTFIVSIFLITKFAKDNHYLKQRLRELQDHQMRAEIKLLKNQLDSHVIFNNLNNLYSMAINNYERIGENIGRFSSLLKYYFITGKEKLVLLESELETIGNFIALEKLRYGERLQVEYTIEGKPMRRKIIPFVLFSFVENCFDHGCSMESGNSWIRVVIKIEHDAVTFHASNSKPQNILEVTEPKDPYKVTKQKLDLLYPGKYLLRIDDRSEQYCLDLKIKN
ncbi:sensor histidine kinase [Bacteroidota bacterium]